MITRNNDFSYEDAEIWLNGIYYPRASLQIKDGFPVDPPFKLAHAAINLKHTAHFLRWTLDFDVNGAGLTDESLIQVSCLESVHVVPRFEPDVNEVIQEGEEKVNARAWRSESRICLIETCNSANATVYEQITCYKFMSELSMQMVLADIDGFIRCGGLYMSPKFIYLSRLY